MKDYVLHPNQLFSLLEKDQKIWLLQSSFLSCPSVIPSFSGLCNSEEQKQRQVGTEKDLTASSSRAFGESRGRADILQHDGLPQIWE
ncbi:hypothetical protein AAC387_Pa12g0944 [Persea americana]